MLSFYLVLVVSSSRIPAKLENRNICVKHFLVSVIFNFFLNHYPNFQVWHCLFGWWHTGRQGHKRGLFSSWPCSIFLGWIVSEVQSWPKEHLENLMLSQLWLHIFTMPFLFLYIVFFLRILCGKSDSCCTRCKIFSKEIDKSSWYCPYMFTYVKEHQLAQVY